MVDAAKRAFLEVFDMVRTDQYDLALNQIGRLKSMKEQAKVDLAEIVREIFSVPVDPVDGHPRSGDEGLEDTDPLRWPLDHFHKLFPPGTMFGIPEWDPKAPCKEGLFWFGSFTESGWGRHKPGKKLWFSHYDFTDRKEFATGAAVTVRGQIAGSSPEGLVLYVHAGDHRTLDLSSLSKPKLASAPEIVISLCWNHGAWLVGGAAKYMAGKILRRPRDFDILVPFSEWDRASVLIPRGTPSNTFGGFKLSAEYSDGKEVHVDVWPGDLTTLLARSSMEMECFHPMSNRYVKSERL